MNLVILEPDTITAVQYYLLEKSPADTGADTNADTPIEYETIKTKLDSVFVVGDTQYRVGYCERTDTMFRSKIVHS